MKGDLIDQVRQLIQNMPDTLNLDTLERRKAMIIKIGEASKKHPLYKKTEAQRNDFYAPLRGLPVEKAILMCWTHFLDRMSNSPTHAHMEGVVVLCFPIIGDLLKGLGR